MTNDAPPPYAEYIEESLWPLAVPIAAIQKMANNPRRHDSGSIKAVAASLKAFKQQKPVVVSSDGEIVAGNGTYQAATEELGWEWIAASRSTISGDDASAYAIADNRTQEKSSFDFDIVRSVFSGLDDSLKFATGFTADEINNALESSDDEEQTETKVSGHDPAAMGDVEYRVLVTCEDSSSQEELIERLQQEGYICQPLMS